MSDTFFLDGEQLADSIETYLYHRRTNSQLIYWVVLLFVTIAIASLPFIYVDVSVQGSGFVRPVIEKTEIKAPIAELVDEVFIKEGQQVKKGDTLLILRMDAPQLRQTYQAGLYDDHLAHIADLTMLVSGKNSSHFQTSVRQQEYSFYIQRKRELETQTEQSRREYERYKTLYDKSFVSMDEYEKYTFAYESKKNELATLIENQRSSWQTELNSYRNQAKEIYANLKQAKTDKDLYVIQSPVDGTVEQFSGIYKGNILQVGQTVAVISPDSTICVEVYVQPRNIGYLTEGQEVKVQVVSFNYNEWGMLRGKVSSISSDYATNEQGTPFYKVKCKLDRNYLILKKTGRKGHLKKGMTVNARFMVARKSLFTLLYQNIDEWLNPTQRYV